MLSERSSARWLVATAWLLWVGCGGEVRLAEASPESSVRDGAAETSETRAQDPAREIEVENLLLITLDTLRADALEGEGPRRAPTPVLDRLGAQAVVFPRAHSHNVMTLPSHANILTGLYPYQHGVRDNLGFVLPETVPIAAEILGREGFATAAVVGAFPLDARFGLARGFDLYDDALPLGGGAGEPTLAERRGDEVVERGLAWWREHEGKRRFLWLHLYDPHAPYTPPEPFASRFADRPYLGEVAATDAFLEPILEGFLEGREAPTLVIVTSDHGEGLGEHGELTHGLFAYETTLRVPLILWAPGLEPGESSWPARHVDVLPTMLDASGVAIPAGLAGRSLLGLSGPEPTTYFEALGPNLNRGWAPLRGVIEGDEKFISLPIVELYDLAEDPAEKRNLASERRARLRDLAGLVPEESTWPPERAEISAEAEAALRSLGYVGGSAPVKKRYTAEDDPKNLVEIDRKIHRFIAHYQRGELDAALALAREVVERAPEMGAGYYHLAQVHLERGDLPEAIEVMNRAVEREVASDALRRQLALSLAEVGKFREALTLLSPLAERGDVDAMNALGLVLSEAGDQAQARKVLERVLELDGDNPAARQNLALAALRSSRWGEAEKLARAALERGSGSPIAWNYLGVALYNLGRKGEAVEAWRRAAELDPKDLEVLYNLGLVAAEVGETRVAREALEAFIAGASRGGGSSDDVARARSLLVRLGGGS